MNMILQEEIEQEHLWLTLNCKEQQYAINSAAVDTIFQLDQPITPLPESSAKKPGIIQLRGKNIPLVDLRIALGMEPQEQEQDAFEAMLEQRKKDHQNWVRELERCLDEDAPFHLATDPHKCAFGTWYDSYQTSVHSVAFHLKRIDEPHKKLHHTAHLAFECPRECEDCQQEKCLRDQLREDANHYMRIVVGLLDEAKQVFRASYRKMCVVVADGAGGSAGLLVDEVVAVESLAVQPLSAGSSLYGSKATQLVPYTGQRNGDKEQILILNTQVLLAD